MAERAFRHPVEAIVESGKEKTKSLALFANVYILITMFAKCSAVRRVPNLWLTIFRNDSA